MRHNVYAIRDVKAEECGPMLILAKHDAVAVRVFVDGLADPKTTLSQHPADYELVRFGTWDSVLCVLEGEPVEVILTGAAWKASQSQLELLREA